MSKQDLGEVLRYLPPLPDAVRERVLVGVDTADDAAVYRLDDANALVATVDVFTPIVDDPRDYGRIAAANSLSDVYAMGGAPLFALSVVGFPRNDLPLSTLGEILAGAAEVATEAGIGIIGGHSIDDAEPKFGLCVIGHVDPARVARNDAGEPGDALVLTKPIGSGIIATAIKRGTASPEVTAAAVETMAALNRDAAAAMVEVGATCATDVTGFGLLGHLHELAHGSGVSARVRASAVPLLPGARALAADGCVPGGSRRNLAFVDTWTRFDDDVTEVDRLLLADAQTSGGLLIAIPADRLDALLGALRARGIEGAHIGALEAGDPGRLLVEV